jgi:hypothetical protein
MRPAMIVLVMGVVELVRHGNTITDDEYDRQTKVR